MHETIRVPYQKQVAVYKWHNSSHISDGTVFHFVKKEIYSMGITEKPTAFGNMVAETYLRPRKCVCWKQIRTTFYSWRKACDGLQV